MKVYCYPADRNSTYVPLLFEGIEDAYERIYRQDGSLRDAIDDLDSGQVVIVHIHWEEFVLRECRSEHDADAAAEAFVREIAGITERNGAIVWTVHNELPHEIPYHRQFLAMRRALARHAAAILLHNAASRDALAGQVALDESRVHQLPHPSYLGRHEDEPTLQAGLLSEPADRRIQAFGWIRLQKGFGQMIGMLSADFLRSRAAHVRISGRGPEAAAVIAQAAERTDVHWDLRHVPDAEIPSLLRSAACVVLPYERMLTSGVALLAMSVGAMIVAVDLPQLRELLPATNHRFLYACSDTDALRRVIDDVFALSPVERRTILQANLVAARDVRPSEIARRLAAIYREVVATRSRSFARRV
jgi:glycosyltransferase involved in cell wall biosynthesis